MRDRPRDRIQALDPESDFERIYRFMVFHEFPWDLRTAGKVMIWHLFANPSTAAVVGATDALVTRAPETSLTFGDLIEHGLDSPVGRATIRTVNRAHRGWPISVEDHRYALAALAVTPVRWLDRHGWRRPTAVERAAVARFYASLGERIGVPGLPRDYDDLAAYLAGCERTRIGYSPAGQVCSDRTLELARASVPAPLRRVVGPAIATLLHPRIRAATGVAEPGRAVRLGVAALLRARALAVPLLPPRRRATTPRTRRGLPPAVHSVAPLREPTPPT
jgi:hypothetical protein